MLFFNPSVRDALDVYQPNKKQQHKNHLKVIKVKGFLLGILDS